MLFSAGCTTEMYLGLAAKAIGKKIFWNLRNSDLDIQWSNINQSYFLQNYPHIYHTLFPIK